MWSKLKKWVGRARKRGAVRARNAGERIPKSLRSFEFDFREIQLKNVAKNSERIKWVLLILTLFLLAQVSAKMVGTLFKTPVTGVARKTVRPQKPSIPAEDYDSILRRNMFNVEGKIPDPFDQGQLDCFSQARPSSQRITLMGTIVMNDERHSVALIQEDSSAGKIAVKKDDLFSDGKLQALKVERKRFCFQVRASQDFEFIEIPDDSAQLGMSGPSLGGAGTSDGISALSETDYSVKRDFLDKNLTNLNEILQTARAVPYIEPGSGKFKGFLVQSVEATSPFAQLGIRQGDVLTGVNSIVLDAPGKGLEAFLQLRNSPKIALEVIRAGQKTTLNFDVK